jgi:hypothetical protein
VPFLSERFRRVDDGLLSLTVENGARAGALDRWAFEAASRCSSFRPASIAVADDAPYRYPLMLRYSCAVMLVFIAGQGCANDTFTDSSSVDATLDSRPQVTVELDGTVSAESQISVDDLVLTKQ